MSVRSARGALTALLAGSALLLVACGKPPSHDECDALLDHYVELLVNSDRPGTNAGELHKLQLQARDKAKRRPRSSARVQRARVAPRRSIAQWSAPNADLLEQCLL